MSENLFYAILAFMRKFHSETDCGAEHHWSECEDLEEAIAEYFADWRTDEAIHDSQWKKWQEVKHACKLGNI